MKSRPARPSAILGLTPAAFLGAGFRFLAIIIIIIGTVPPAQARDFVVANTNDSGAGSLRQAIALAQGTIGEDRVIFDPSLSGALIILSGRINIADPTAKMIVDGTALVNPITLRCTTDRIFQIHANQGGAEIRGLRLTGSSRDAPGGGGISNADNLILKDCVFEDCRANGSTRGGGAIYNTYGTMTIEDCVFRNCRAANAGSGGAIFSTGHTAKSAAVTLRRCVFEGNSISDSGPGEIGGDGGAVFQQMGLLTIEDCTFIDNSAGRGGDGALRGGSGLSGGRGGAVFCDEGTFTGATFSRNRTGDGGAGADDYTDPIEEGGNGGQSGRGGAVYGESGSGGELNFTNCTFFENETGDGGDAGDAILNSGHGGISGTGSAVLVESGLSASLRHCTVASNFTGTPGTRPTIPPESAVRGKGALFGSFRLANSVVAQNTPSDIEGTIQTPSGVNFIGDTGGITFGLIGNELTGDPMLAGALADNGGETETLLPLSGSPLINGTTPLSTPVATDQRGVARVMSLVEIGAVEVPEFPAIADLRIGPKPNPATHNSSAQRNPTGAGQKIKVKVKGTRKKKFYVSVQNDGEKPATLITRCNRPNRSLRLKVFRKTGGRANVTGPATRRGYGSAGVGAGEVVVFECQVRAKSRDRKARQTLTPYVVAASNPAVRDLGKAKIIGK